LLFFKNQQEYFSQPVFSTILILHFFLLCCSIFLTISAVNKDGDFDRPPRKSCIIRRFVWKISAFNLRFRNDIRQLVEQSILYSEFDPHRVRNAPRSHSSNDIDPSRQPRLAAKTNPKWVFMIGKNKVGDVNQNERNVNIYDGAVA
jgi:hypothetical protein